MVGGIEKYFQIAKCFGTKTCARIASRSLPRSSIEVSFVQPDDISRSSKDCSRQFFVPGAGSRSRRHFRA